MKHDYRTQKRAPRPTGIMHKLFAKPNRLPATATQEQDWESEVPGIKLSTAFMVILFLHVVVVGGVMLFRFMEKDSPMTMAGAPAGTRQTKAASQQGNANTRVRLDDPAFKDLPTHRVKPHETIDMIAGAHGVTRDAITRTNNLDTDNPFREGMTLVIPPAEAGATNTGAIAAQVEKPAATPRGERPVAQARPVPEMRVAPARAVPDAAATPRVSSARPVADSATTKPVANVQGGREYVLKPGETLWAVAQRNGVSVNELLKANGITDAKKVRNGTVLRLPAKN